MLTLLLLACTSTKQVSPDSPAVDSEPVEVEDAPDISEALAAAFPDEGAPALVGAYLSSDGLLGLGVAGVRKSDGEDPALREDPFHLGSDTKAMTAALLGLLHDDGTLALDTPLEQLWPDAEAGWRGVTLLQLLQHQGGAPDSLAGDRPDLWSGLWANPDDPPGARAELAAALLADPPDETVGRYAYSNAGYILVGAAMELRTGEAWESLMRERLFTPLEMRACSFGAPLDPAPWGHRESGGALEPVDPTTAGSDNPPGLGPAGTVHCPMADWADFIAWVLRGARGEDERMSAETWTQLLTPNGSYAGGWGVGSRSWAGGTVYSHAGSNTMWYAVAWVAPGIDRAYLSASNAATSAAIGATDDAVGVMIDLDSAR